MRQRFIRARLARATAAAALILTSIVGLPLALAGQASAASRIIDTESGCKGYALYTRGGAAEEIGSGIGAQNPVGVKGYCSGTRPYRVQIVCTGGSPFLQGPKVRSGYSAAYCPKGKRVDGAYVFRTS